MIKKMLLVLSLLAFPMLAAASFPDVYQNTPHREAILYLQNEGIVQGYPSGQYDAERNINRAEFLKIVVGAQYEQDALDDCSGYSLDDVDASEWYASYVCVGIRDDIIDGYPDGTFKGAFNINFAEAAKIVANSFGDLSVDETEYENWYRPYAEYLSDNSAIPEDIEGYDKDIDRGQMAEIIYRLMIPQQAAVSLTADEVSDYEIIREYYSDIWAKEYSKAYEMKYEPSMSLEEFTELYQEFPFTRIEEYSKVGEHTYDFYVRGTYYNQESPVEMYDVSMEVIDGKLRTISADQIDYRLIERADYDENKYATVEFEDGEYAVYLYENGESTLIKKSNHQEEITQIFKELRFSESGDYLVFVDQGWEWASIYVYDTAHEDIDAPKLNPEPYPYGIFGFNPDETAFFICSESGMIPGSVHVIGLPYRTNVFTLDDQDVMIAECGPYDPETNILHFKTYVDGLIDQEVEVVADADFSP
ncbi:hypothetical protein GF376_02460 [Candidatus Peregrinibacteria bacterium]|nr:hypothetical protein [Candidatus Peregrinibacteria bacterium]